ncbi:spore cortex-lytic enzyme [Effusibacillus lacus]|uniref:Spore cortex-lytic enzyme n=1 Tax=Effusibacillus lacus TaxID=1348429 RepID=A0A292YNQ4_9BACL|nr:spore cortex-lytic enzyme [Effusibacillus lacus]TCS74904.1 N-acetylmuramoyl-L-alanine amidase [Effusibacillus lacus]GAX91578.1 spore cortex-lytic enzyme [Effusibacillus lacus]
MTKQRYLILLIFVVLLSGFCLPQASSVKSQAVPAFSKTTVYRGARGGDVWELQGRLKYLGFYKGPIDGIFGTQTYWALRNFQYKFGLRVDGILGPKTKLMLWKATKNWRPGGTGTTATGRFSANDIRLLQRTVYGEARGEPYIGQVAVAAVVLNRVDHRRFPKTVAGVIFQPGAFTAVADGQIWLEPNSTARKAALDAINGWDPSGGALYYFNPATATSRWIWSRPQIKRIGKHIFTR